MKADITEAWGPFLESPDNCSGPKAVLYVCRICTQDQSFGNNFENGAIKFSVNERKFTGLWAKNCDTIQQVLISKFAVHTRKVIGPFEKQAPAPGKLKSCYC